jgi:hypothetical protein
VSASSGEMPMVSGTRNYSKYNSRKRAIIKEILNIGHITDDSPEIMDILFECVDDG